MESFRLISVLFLLFQLLIACSNNDSMNKIVQNGGTVLVSVGTREELGYANLAREDLSAKLIDSGGQQSWVRVRQVFPLDVDSKSPLNSIEVAEGSVVFKPRNGFSGFWFAVIDLLDVDTGLATRFNAGQATLEIYGLATVQRRSINILPGRGTINPVMGKVVAEGDFLFLLRPVEQVRYILADPEHTFNEENLLGAIEFQFDYNAADVGELPPSQWPRAVFSGNDDHIQVLSRTETESETHTLHVVIMNPAGIGHISEQSAETAEFYRASDPEGLRFSIVYPPEVGPAPFEHARAITGYGIDGEALSIDALTITKPTL